MEDYRQRLVLEAIRRGNRSLEDIARDIGGIYPLELRALLANLQRSGKITWSDTGFVTTCGLDNGRSHSPSESTIFRPNALVLPEPHPHDYDWRFDQRTARMLSKLAIDSCLPDAGIVLLGAPTVFAEIARLLAPPPTCLLDASAELVELLQAAPLPASCTVVHHDLLSGFSWDASFPVDVIVCDPPWYEEYYAAFLAQGAHSLRVGGRLYLSLLPSSTRGDAVEGRRSIYSRAHQLGFDVEGQEVGVIRYETPSFERRSLEIADIDIQGGWRKGDLLVLRKVQQTPTCLVPASLSEAGSASPGVPWGEMLMGRYKVKVRGPFDDVDRDPQLIKIEEQNMLPTVSRRYPGRGRIDLWLWDNRVFGLRGRASFWAALHALAGRPIPPEVDVVVPLRRDRAADLLQGILGY